MSAQIALLYLADFRPGPTYSQAERGGQPHRAWSQFPPMSSCLLPHMSANPPPSRPFPSIILPADQPVKLFGQFKTPRWGRAICSFYRFRCGSMRNRPCREIRRPALGRPPGRRRGENPQLLPVSLRFNAGSTRTSWLSLSRNWSKKFVPPLSRRRSF